MVKILHIIRDITIVSFYGLQHTRRDGYLLTVGLITEYIEQSLSTDDDVYDAKIYNGTQRMQAMLDNQMYFLQTIMDRFGK